MFDRKEREQCGTPEECYAFAIAIVCLIFL